MANVKAKVSNNTDNEVSSSTRSAFVIAKKLEEFTDINTELLTDGSTLVYNEQRDEWDTINELRAQSIDAGEF